MGLLDFLFKQNKKKDNSSGNKMTWVDAQFIEDPLEREKILLSLVQSETNPIDLHFTYNQLIELYFKKREKWVNAMDNCIEICKEDIELFPKIKKEYQKRGDTIPRMPSFKRLAIIYEKEGNLEEAIKICDMAIQYELTDKTKGGFEGRKKRLENKLS